jgi:phage gp29-like protein
MLWFPRNLDVQTVVNILRASRMGDMWQLASLVEVMLDSWPVLKKCQHELRSAVSTTKFSVHPFAEEGKKPTKSAEAKAALVRKAMFSFRPDPRVTDEHGFDGMVYDLANAYLIGLSLVELQWHNVEGNKLPRACTFVHPAHIVLDDLAMINITNSVSGETIPFNPNYFISVFQSQSGSAYAMGMVRSVGWWWSAMLATQQWIFGSAQKYGSPYTFLTYARALMGNKPELDKIEQSLNASGANRWIMAPEGCEADLKPPGTMGSDNPQRYLKEQADKEVMMLFLGQTSSTNSEPGKLGNNDQHMEVRTERKEGVAKWIGSILTEQFAPAILRRNFNGDDTECPTVEPDLTEVETRTEAAQRVAQEISTGLPFVAEEIYKDLNRKVPEEGDRTVQRGQLGIMRNPEETPIQPGLEEQVEQQEMIAEAAGAFEEPQPVAARTPRIRASAYIGDITVGNLPEDVEGEVMRFLPSAKSTTRIARYGMVAEELANKVDPQNWRNALEHCSSDKCVQEATGANWMDDARSKFEARRDGKYILLMNDRIVDGHHFLALANMLGVTSSLNVLDLTPARLQLKASQPVKAAESKKKNGRTTWITLRS